MFDDFGGRMPTDKPPVKTPGELAIERGEPWPPPVEEPAYKAAIAEASRAADAATRQNGANGAPGGGYPQPNGQPRHGQPQHGQAQPDYGAPAGWYAPGGRRVSPGRPAPRGNPLPPLPPPPATGRLVPDRSSHRRGRTRRPRG